MRWLELNIFPPSSLSHVTCFMFFCQFFSFIWFNVFYIVSFRLKKLLGSDLCNLGTLLSTLWL